MNGSTTGKNLVTSFSVLVSSFMLLILLFGCTQTNYIPITKTQDINFSASDANKYYFNDGNIAFWNAVIIPTRTADTNWQTSFPIFDANMKATYQPKGTYATIDTNTQTVGWTLGGTTPVFVKDTNFNENVFIAKNVHIDGNVSFHRPYGMFSSMKTQTIASANTAYYMDFNTTEDSYLITKTGDTNFKILQSGDYKIELSIIATSTIASKRVNIWVRKNGVDVPRSNTPYDFKGTNSIAVISVPFIIDLLPTDTFSVMYGADSTGVSLPALASTSYTPATPSAIMTIDKISEIPSV